MKSSQIIIFLLPLKDTGDSDLASINEDIQNIALDNVEQDPVLNDLSSGKVVSRQGLISMPQTSKQTTQHVNHTTFQQCTSNQCIVEQSAKSTYSAPWMPSTSTGTGNFTTMTILTIQILILLYKVFHVIRNYRKMG